MWFDNKRIRKYNDNIPYPSMNDESYNLSNNLYSHWDYKINCDNKHFNFKDPVKDDGKNKLIVNHKKRIDAINILYTDPVKKEIKIKECKTKHANLINNYDKILKQKKVKINFNKKQSKIILGWINECLRVYNKCVDLFNTNPKDFNLNNKKSKTSIFNKLGPKKAPYDTLTDEIRSFCSNVKGNFTAIKNNNRTHFTMTHKKKKNIYSLYISKKAISKNGIFSTLLGKQLDFPIDPSIIGGDSRLLYNYKDKTFYLSFPTYDNKKIINNRKDICALDPGEKIFMAYYGLDSYGMIGNDIRKKILFNEMIIRKLNSN